MESLDEKILDVVQDGFPLEDRPYAALGKVFGISEELAFARVEALRESGVIRRLGGVYNSRALGFVSRLCAGHLPLEKGEGVLEKLAQAAAAENSITHNYLRNHFYNVWFTVIAESGDRAQKIVDSLVARTGLEQVHLLSAKKMFKINTVMGCATSAKNNVATPVATVSELTADDKERIRKLSMDIPHTLTPFADLGVSLDEIRDDLQKGRMRRFGAVLKHQDAGFVANSMVCLDVEHPEAAGVDLAALPFVSHCYEREAFEGFPFNLYAMVHAHSGEELEKFVEEVVRTAKAKTHARLDSLKELKKSSYAYFG